MPGLDGRKMSKSYGNTIGLREDPDSVAKKLKTMQTDPARVRRTDPGDPDKCPVWDLHKIYSSDETQAWVQQGCRTAGIGCLDCKKPLIDKVVEEITAIRERAQEFEENRDLVRGIIAEGCEKARDVARETLRRCAQAMGIELPMKPDLTELVENTGRAGNGRRDRAAAATGEMPFAVVEGEPVTELPRDLYIPPDALAGVPRGVRGSARPAAVSDPPAEPRHPRHPDRRDHAPVHAVHRADAGAAARARRRVPADGRDARRDQVAHAAAAACPWRGRREDDPRAELVRRLQEYERFKKAAEDIDELPRLERDTWPRRRSWSSARWSHLLPQVTLQEMLVAFKDVLSRAEMFAHHHVQRERLSVRQRMSDILGAAARGQLRGVRAAVPARGRADGRDRHVHRDSRADARGLIEIVQTEAYAPIHVRPGSGAPNLIVVADNTPTDATEN